MNDQTHDPVPPTDAERARAAKEQLKHIHAFDLAYEMLISLVSFGYQKMGLTEETRELRDLDDAKIAIEVLRAVLDALEREKGAALLGDLRSTLAQMQLSYARAAQAARAESGPAKPVTEEAPEAEPEKAPAAEPEPEASAVEEAPARKPATTKPANKPPAGKPAAKKSAKKPAAKKPPARKPTAKKPPAAG